MNLRIPKSLDFLRFDPTVSYEDPKQLTLAAYDNRYGDTLSPLLVEFIPVQPQPDSSAGSEN